MKKIRILIILISCWSSLSAYAQTSSTKMERVDKKVEHVLKGVKDAILQLKKMNSSGTNNDQTAMERIDLTITKIEQLQGQIGESSELFTSIDEQLKSIEGKKSKIMEIAQKTEDYDRKMALHRQKKRLEEEGGKIVESKATVKSFVRKLNRQVKHLRDDKEMLAIYDDVEQIKLAREKIEEVVLGLRDLEKELQGVTSGREPEQSASPE